MNLKLIYSKYYKNKALLVSITGIFIICIIRIEEQIEK